MAIVKVQTGTRPQSATQTLTSVLTDTPVKGNLLICAVAEASTGTHVDSIVQSGVTWALAVKADKDSEIWYGLVTESNASKNCLVTFSNSVTNSVCCIEYSGVAAVVDKTAYQPCMTGDYVPTGTTGVTTQDDELWFACWGYNNIDTGSFYSVSNGFNAVTTLSTGYLHSADRYVNTKGAATCTAYHSRGTYYMSGCIATFKAKTKNLVGIIRSFMGVPIPDATVTAFSSDDDIVRGTTTSDVDGKYVIPVIEGQTHYVMGWKAGEPILPMTGWDYVKSHSITHVDASLTGFQMKFTVKYGSGTDSAGTVYCNSHCKTDFSDVRFSSSDLTTVLPYWIESKTDGDQAIFWVTVADDLSEIDKTVYMCYGNSTATSLSTSSIFSGIFTGYKSNLKVWFPCDETSGTTVYDQSGNGKNITHNAGGFVTGKFGNCWNSGGSVDTFPDISSLMNTGVGTIAFWVYFNATGGSMGLVGICNNKPLIYNSNGQTVFFWSYSSGLPTDNQYMKDPDPFPIGSWHHVACVWNTSAKTIKMYKDGALINSWQNSGASMPVVQSATSTFGCYSGGNYLNGKLDSVMVFNRELTEAEIALLAADTGCPYIPSGTNDIYLRKSVGVEPTHGTWSREYLSIPVNWMGISDNTLIGV